MFAKNPNNSCPVFEIKQTITFSSQKNEVVLNKRSGYLVHIFQERAESFFIRSPKSMYSSLGISFEKDAQKTQAFFWTLWMQFLQSWQKVSVKKTKRFLTNIRTYWNNHVFFQKYLNFNVKIFWARILPFWQAWIDFWQKIRKKSGSFFANKQWNIFSFPQSFFFLERVDCTRKIQLWKTCRIFL